jgi:16S rRNA (guanine966-N2)-methyltransferase
VLRIVGGQWRGRKIKVPAGERVRPTADRVREAWMSIVQPALPAARVLDLFAGSGALGLEALSRGASHVDFVEMDAASLRALRENVDLLGAEPSVTVHRGDAMRFVDGLDRGAYGVAFADPPYRMGLAGRLAERWLDTPFASVIGIEHETREHLPEGGDMRRYGSTAITFYRADE